MYIKSSVKEINFGTSTTMIKIGRQVHSTFVMSRSLQCIASVFLSRL